MMMKSTKDQMVEFIESSFVWKDIKHELNIWIKAARVEYHTVVGDALAENISVGSQPNRNSAPNDSTAKVLMRLGDIHGRVEAIEHMLALPDVFLQILEEEKDGT